MALYEFVDRINKTMQRRDDTEFLIGCESFSIALLIFCSDMRKYNMAMNEAETAEALAKALPPHQIEIDGRGKSFISGADLHIHVAEIKYSKRSNAWKQGQAQLERALCAIGFAVEHCLDALDDQHPLAAYDKVVLVGYLCVPRELATFKQVQASILSRANDDVDNGLRVICKTVIL